MRRDNKGPFFNEKSFKKNCRKQLFGFLLIGLILSFIPLTQISYAAPPSEPKYVPDRLLIKFNHNVPENARQSILAENGASAIDEIPQIGVKVIRVPENALEGIENALKKNPSVQYVEKDLILEPAAIPNDTYFSRQWHIKQIGADIAWDKTKGSKSIAIAILDTGVDSTHPDLSPKLVSGYNFYNNDNNWSDICGHGTAVAGTAAAVTNNALGVAGVAWENSIIPIRIADPNCYAAYSTMTKAITYAADKGAKVANISYRVFNGAAFNDAAKYMYDKGGFVVVAGGNTGKYENYADNPYVISVSATHTDDTITSFSSSGPYIDFAAPGIIIYTTVKGGMYDYVSGTSFSAPITSGVIGLLFSANPSLTSDQVYNILKQSSVDRGTIGYDNYFGWGRIDAAKAISLAGGNIVDTTPPLVSISSPQDGSTVSGKVMASVKASDNASISKLQVYIDSTLNYEGATSSYDSEIDTTKLSSGPHVIKAVAYDSSNNMGTSQVTINVSNTSLDTTPPLVSISSPQDGSTVSGKVMVSVKASDNVGISKVKIFADNKLLTTLSCSLCDHTWNSRSVSIGSHTLSAEAYDVSGNVAKTSITIVVTK